MTSFSASQVAAEVVPNAEAIEAWNTVLFEKFVKFRRLVTSLLSPHGAVAMRRAAPRPGESVLDIGSGFGDDTVALARAVGPGGLAYGVDAAPRFVALGRDLAALRGVANARFGIADVQRDPLGGPYDLAFSRFGTMFFDSPVAAMRNVRRSLADHGRLAMSVWRKKSENQFYAEAEDCVLEIVGNPIHDDGPTCGPGPFSLANPDVVRGILAVAGFRNVELEPLDVEVFVGDTVDEAIELALAIGPAGEVMRLAGFEAEELRPKVVDALRRRMAGWQRPDGVFAGTSTWVVTARAD